MTSEQATDELPVPGSAASDGSARVVTQELRVRRSKREPDGSEQVTDKLRAPSAPSEAESDGKDTAEKPPPRKGRLWRELSGALAAGLVLLAVAVLVLQIVSWNNGVPGLGVVELIGHVVAAGLAVYAQRVIDRRPGRPALIAGLGMAVLVSAVLVLFWWI